jgi:uncharacterized repeat protein (TIGR01451 family)/fimbrial isopeptide formation D2 family protein
MRSWGRRGLLAGIAVAVSLTAAPGASAQGTTPELTKTFTPNQVQVGETTTLQLSITNPSASAQNWSFTDQLSAALKVAQSTPTANTCNSTTVTAPLDGHQIQVNGQVPGSGSCAVSMKVQVTETGTHVNEAGNITQSTNISPPTSPTQVQCADPDDPPVDDIVGVFVNCDFSDAPPANDFTIKQDWQSTTSTVAYQTPVIGDLFGTGDPAIVAGGNRNGTGGNPLTDRLANDLKVYDGATGNVLHTITTPRYSWSSFAVAAIADVNEDGRGEIIFRAASHSQTQADANAAGVPTPADIAGRLIAYEYDPGGDDWDVMWVSDHRYDHVPDVSATSGARSGAAISLADFNGDGNAEVYVGNEVFNARTGARLAAGAASAASGCQQAAAGGCFLAQSVAVDTDGNGDLELAAGDSVYDVQITNPNGEAGNSMTIAQTANPANANAKDGMTAVADMDLDGAPELVVTTNGTTTASTVLYVWDPQTGTVEGMKTGAQMAQGNGTSGSAPMIGDIDGDGRPEIVIVTTNRLRAYDLVPGSGLNEIWTLTVADGSGGTSTSMFDFNNDGEQEIVYRDEGNIRIIDGGPTPPNTTNRNLASFACVSGTSVDMPVIADIDGSGEARIVVTCGVTNNTTGAAVRSYETASFPWANTRPVWNQQAYFITHINDDLTVPEEQFPNWTVFNDPDQRCSDGANRPLNNFQVQVTDLDSETGCPVICVPPSLEVDKTSDPPTGEAVEPGETVEYTITIENTSSDDVTDVDLTDDLSNVLDDATITSGPTVGPPGAGTAQINGNQLAFNGTIPDGETVTITYEATVKPRPQLGDRVLGNAVIGEFSNCDGITGQLRCKTEHAVSVRRTDLELEKTGDAVVDPGDPVGYTLTVTNHGPDASTGSTVTDTLPNGLTNIQSTTPGCTVQGQTVTCDIGSLASGDSTDIEITADAPSTPSTCVDNEASVEADDDDPNSSSDDASFRTCTNPAADLRIEKTASADVVSPGGQFQYQLSVFNDGPGDSTGSTVTDTLPAGVNVLAYNQNDCDLQGQTLTCDVGPLATTQAVQYTILVEAPNTPSSCLENVASIEGNEGDPDLADNETDPRRVCTTPAADVAVSKSGPAQVDAGGQVTYTLDVQNNGPDDAHNVVVTDTLPNGLTNIQAAGCQVQGQTVTCSVGTVPGNGAVPPIQITAKAPNVGSTCFENVASAEGDEGDPDLSNNESDPVETCTRQSDLELQKTGDQIVDPGDPVSYTLTVTNHGPDQSTQATVTDTLPAELQNVQVPQGCQLQGQTLTCTIGPLDPDDSTDIVVNADAPNTPATCFTNEAEVEGSSDPTSSNDSDSLRTCTTPAADLELEKSAPAEVDPGGQVTWTLTVTNNGPQGSSGATVTDTLPNDITNIQAPQGCLVQAQAITCDVDPLDADESVDIQITGTAPNTPEDCFSNDASVGIDSNAPDEADPDPSNNEASVETCTNEGADLEIAKTADAGPYSAGDDVTYTLTVTNHGPATAHDVEVTDDLPDSLTLVSVSPQADCTQTDPVNCDVDTLAPEASVDFTIVATIADDQSGNSIENSACAEGAEPDRDDSNDCATEPIDVEPEADVQIEKVVDPTGSVLVGDLLSYTLTVTNNGPNDAEDVAVGDGFSDDAQIESVTPSQGTCSQAPPISCQLGDMANGATATITVEARPLHKGDLANDAVVTTTTEDTDPSNNEDAVTTPVKAPKLTLKKRAKQSKASPGDVVDYEIEVRSKTDVPLRNLRMCDKLPKQLDLVGAPGADVVHGNTACWKFDLPANGSRSFKIRARVKPTKYPLKVRNTAKLTGADVRPARDRDGVAVKPDDDGRGPGPCTAGGKRC